MQLLDTKKVDKIKKITVVEDNNTFTYKLDDVTYKVRYPRDFLTVNKDLIKTFTKEKIKVEFQNKKGELLVTILPIIHILIILVIAFYVLRSFAGNSLSNVEEVKNEKITFDDIAGYIYVKEELKEIVDFLNNPKSYSKYTDKTPKGVLLEGPPGNGKTLFAKAVAGETDTPFFQISASDIEGMFVGSGAMKLNKVFTTVKKRAQEAGKAILFIDEIDAVGINRERRTVVETNQTINKLLTELDGFDKNSKIVVMAATNLATVLDPALTRAGRFDRVIKIPRPNTKDRESVLSLYLEKRKDLIHGEVFEEKYVTTLAQQTEGFCNADLDKLVNEASLVAKKSEKEKIDIKCLREAFTRIVAGVRMEHQLSEEDKKIISYHEAGHAVAKLLTSKNPLKSIAYITITPYGESLGHVAPVNEHSVLIKRSDLENDIKVMLAGRAVEENILSGDYTTGAASDLQQANRQLLLYVTKYGMSENAENMFLENLDENTAVVQKEIKSIRERLYADTKNMIEIHFEIVERIAEHLLVHESIEQHELGEILKGICCPVKRT